jgi:cytochrome c-type biogenesis protein CcmF
MIVHLGVVLIAVGFAASHSFSQTSQLTLAKGRTAAFDGHTFTYLGTEEFATATHTGLRAEVRVDGGRVYGPAVDDYPFATETIGTPSVDSNAFEDVYLTFASTPTTPQGPAGILVIVEPLVSWIWVGGAIMLIGTVLAAWPGRRRRSRRQGAVPEPTAIATEKTRAPPAATGLEPGDEDGVVGPPVPAGSPK